MSPKEQAKEIYFSMLNAGKGMISGYLANVCARNAVYLQINERDTGIRKQYWEKVLNELKKIHD